MRAERRVSQRLIHVFLWISLLCPASLIYAGVVGSKHDFSVGGGSAVFAFDTFQVCVFCHTPHGANMNTKNMGTSGDDLNGFYVWNRNSPGQVFDVYRNDTLEYAGNRTSPQPGTMSRLCLSCHDGIGAINVLLSKGTLTANDTGTTINQIGDASADPYISRVNIGGGSNTGPGLDPAWGTGGSALDADHPIGFVYNSVLADSDGQLKTPDSQNYVDAGRIIRLFRGRLECSTCHNPHDNQYGSFLVMDNGGSALCVSCHLK